jgi:hypothetical protein
MPLPEPEETAVTAQRAAVIRQAMQMAAAQPSAAPKTWLARLLTGRQGNHTTVWRATAVAMTLLLLLAAGLFFRNRPAAPVTNIEAEPAADTETAAADNADGPSLLDRLFGRSEGVEEEDIAASPEPAETAAAVAAAPESDLGFTTFLPIMTDPLQISPQTAVLGDLRGVVSVQGSDGSWIDVNTIHSLNVGDRVQTGPFSGATLTFYDGSQAQIGPDSELSIDQLNALRPEAGNRTVVLTQWRGDSTHEVQFRNDNGSRYEVKSPSGTGIARGTTFKVLVLPDLTSRYTVLKGRVDVISVNVTVSVLAGQLSTILAGTPPATPVFQVNGQGEVTEIGETWTVGGQTFATYEQTVIVGNPQVGDWVSVSGHLLPDGTRVADLIRLLRRLPQNEFNLTAPVTEIDESAWIIGGQTVVVDADTAVDPAIELGDLVRVAGIIQADGTLLAQHIQQLDQDAELPFEFTGIVQTIADDAWLISGLAVQVNGRTEIKEDPEVGDVVQVEGYILLDGTWLAEEIRGRDDDENQSNFEFSGTVESTEPWRVAGILLTTDDWTEIEADIAIGDQVLVVGDILPDGTWLATEIKLLIEEADATILHFVGTVLSIDPWLVNDLSLLVTDESVIAPGIVVGDLVQVVARLLPDGTWEILQIRPLLPPTTGCFTVYGLVTAVTANQIVLANWPALSLTEDIQIDGSPVANSIISFQICTNGDNNVIIIIVVIQQVVIVTPGNDGNDGGGNNGNGQGTICHNGQQTLTLPQPAINAHLGHGDTLGACSSGGGHDDDDDDD